MFSPWLISVVLEPAEDGNGNNFVDNNNGLISGTVKDDKGNVLEGVNIELHKLDVSDYDASDDGDLTDSNRAIDDAIGVVLKPGEKDTDNNFVDSNNGAITGTVKDDNGNPIPAAPIQLQLIEGTTTTVVGTTTTDSNGAYSFVDVEPGNYIVIQSNLPTYPVDVSDYDTIPDGDSTDTDTVVDSSVGVTVEAGETDGGNDFVDSDNGLISGTVTDDNGNRVPGTPITLKDAGGVVVLTTTTDSDGKYVFTNLEPGDYTIIESNLPQYPGDVSDYDENPDGDGPDLNKTTDNVIGVTIKPGEADVGNNFVDTDNGSISGSVTSDDDEPLVGVVLQLLNPDGSIVATTTTDSTGKYIFPDVEPGEYTVKETNPSGYPVNISDYDADPDGDDADKDTKVDNSIDVSLKPGENDDSNDFVDSDKGSIGGSVTDEAGEPLKDVILTLTKPDGTTVTTVTDSNGEYTFVGLPPGEYTVTETDPPGYPGDLSDYDEDPDGDVVRVFDLYLKF